jgi:hypothetical protein
MVQHEQLKFSQSAVTFINEESLQISSGRLPVILLKGNSKVSTKEDEKR